MNSKRLVAALLFLCGSAGISHGYQGRHDESGVVHATLSNGLQVVIVPDSLAPVVAVELNVLAGGDESPARYPGMAHAQEHMAFRGCAGMNSGQIGSLYAELGGQDNAETEQNLTRYYVTVPAGDLDVALQAQAACVRGIDDSQSEWEQERGAIEQEVEENLSDPWYRFSERIDADMFAGSPYAQDSLGTKSSFDATTAQMLKEFHDAWYTPNNMILVVAGDVSADATLARIKDLFNPLPRHDLPARPAVRLHAVKAESFTLDSDLPNVVGVAAFRFPGTDSRDYAALQVLADVLSSPRSNLYKLESSGKILDATFDLAETYPKASVGYGEVEVPRKADAPRAIHALQKILAEYAKRGVPEDLVEAAKRNELASVAFERNSIPELADVWSNAVAAEHRNSPDEDVAAIQKVTALDVDRVAAQYLNAAHEVVGTLIPEASQQPTSGKRSSGAEKATAPPDHLVALPSWAAGDLEQLKMPAPPARVSDMLLENGLRLIVETDSTSPTVLLRGCVKPTMEPQSARNVGALSDVLEGFYEDGTQDMDRLTFERALDDIAADETAGYSFSLDVLKANFSRGVQLLAENELHPAFSRGDFRRARRQASRFVAGTLKSPEYRTSQALTKALLPHSDPELQEMRPDAFKKVSLKAVARYHAATIRPDLTTIVIVGDVSPEEARAVIERWFGEWKGVGPTPRTTLPPVPLNPPSSAHVFDPGVVQDSVTIAEQLDLNRFDPDYYPLQLGSTILGGDYEATRLYHDLRQQTGYVYDVDLDLDASATRATYSISFGSDPRDTGKAREIIQRDIEQMRTSEVSADELHQAKAFLLRQIPLSLSSEEDVAEDLLARAEMGLPLDEPVREVERYLSLSPADIKAAFARRIRPDDFVEVVSGPAAR